MLPRFRYNFPLVFGRRQPAMAECPETNASPDEHFRTMKIVANLMIGLGLVMLLAYYVIGLRTGSIFLHEPFVMLPGGIVCLLGGLVARFVLPRL